MLYSLRRMRQDFAGKMPIERPKSGAGNAKVKRTLSFPIICAILFVHAWNFMLYFIYAV